jgi:hypothetical protein
MTIDRPDLHDLSEALDASFGDGPAPLPPGDHLAVGRSSLRRRRRLEVVGSGVLVAAVVTASFALTGRGGDGPQGADPVAPGPSVAAPSASSAQDQSREDQLDELSREAQEHAEKLQKERLVSNQFPAALDDSDGELVVKDGWQVIQQVDEPVGYEPPEKSLGVVVTDGEQTLWMLLTLDKIRGDGGKPIDGRLGASASSDEAGKGYSRFEDWLASMIALNGGPQPSPLVTVSADDEVLAGSGSTLLDVQEVPVVEGYTSPGDRVARVRHAGRVWFAVVRGHGPDAEVIPVDGDVLPDSTLDALLAYLAQQTGSGEGVR